ncbi:MAG: hypothetical protein V1847_04650 [Candidatus Diapherotrites archaeon]
MRLFEQYSKLPEFDFFNHEIENGQKTNFGVLIDEKTLSSKAELQALQESLLNQVGRIAVNTKEWDKKKWLAAYAKALFGSIKPLTLKAGIPTEPPKKVFKRIEERAHEQNVQKIVSQQKQASFEEIRDMTRKSFESIFKETPIEQK